MIAPGGFVLLAAIRDAAVTCEVDLTITSACDGEHSGPTDPHHRGEAYDIRTHDMTPEKKQEVLSDIQDALGDRFFAFLESPATENEHIHCQVKKGTTYP